jgi:DNA polymerase III epsilon subunit-like protein
MDLSLESKTVDELKLYLKKYDLVSNISTLKRNDLIKVLRSVIKYKNNKQTDYSTYNFGNNIVKLNEQQTTIVTSDINKHIRIIACAGSGKTTTVICRIKYLIDQGIDPERIMLTAFNVDAAESMKSKLMELFGFMPKICVGTIDSIACRYYYRYFKQDFNVGVNEYAYYFLKYLQSDGNILSSIYHYVFFDEFQDVNDIQFQILQCFYNFGAKICVIGDDAQNIYSFRGSNMKYILNLEKYFKNLKTYKLINNYRSTPEIINLANSSIKLNTEQIPKDMISNNKSINFIPVVKYYDNSTMQNNEIIKAILEYNKNGIPFEEMAVICRINTPLKLLEEAIEKINKKTGNHINYVALINDDNADTKPKIKPNHITLTTIHKSKGLEWRVIFIIDCDDSRFPSETDKLSIQEERRLFYVAITRAKQYLYITFSGYNNIEQSKIPKITRFIQELDNNLYDFTNADKKFFSYEDYRSMKWINGVTDTIKLLNELDIVKLRNENILPKSNPIIKKIHEKHEFNKFITSYYLQPDFGEFIDRYITRSIGRRNINTGGLIDIPTIIIISSSQFINKELTIYKKYENNFKLNIRKINLKTPDWKYYSILSENDIQLNNIRKIEINDHHIIKSIVLKILLTANKFNIDVSVLANCFCIKNEISDKIKKKLIECYKKYNSQDINSNQICYDIYNVSLCGTILNGRRRLLYKDVYDNFTNGYDTLFNDIEKYIDIINPEFTNLLCKKLIKNDEYDIMGEFDLLDVDNQKLIDFKCSSSDKFKLQWILQILAYIAIIKKSYTHISIKEIEVYNPVQGEIYTLDISDWNKEDEYLAYLYEIRVRQATRNIDIDKKIESDYFPIQYDNMDNGFVNDKTTEIINNLKINITDSHIFDLRKIFGNKYNEFLNFILNNRQSFTKYEKIIDKFNTFNNKRYMVIDTETTGLPDYHIKGIIPTYTDLEKYNNARMIQICWAIYNDDKLQEFQNFYIKPNGFTINNTKIHGITTDFCNKNGHNLNNVLTQFGHALNKVKYIVGHNVKFDYNIICSEFYRNKFMNFIELFNSKQHLCTMEKSISLKVDGCLKATKLINLYKFLFNKEFSNQHNAKYDVIATNEVFIELIKLNLIEI